MLPLELDYRYLQPEIEKDAIEAWQDELDLADGRVTKGTGRGRDFLGWVDPSKIVTKDEVARIKDLSKRIRDNSEYLIVVGIGGSYLGARAVVEALADGTGPEVLFAGNSLSAHYHSQILRKVQGKPYSINVISKSGTTTEPAVAFRLVRSALEAQVGKDEARKRIVATTDEKKGALRHFASQEGYDTLRIADDVGGRYSVLSPVGLLPIAVAGIDIDALLAGARDTAEATKDAKVMKNPAAFYAAARNQLYRQGKQIEILASFEPRLHFVAEWWKQLYGESEGKENSALFPASVDFTADLHSMGQWIQQGRRSIMETFIVVKGGEPSLTIPAAGNLDELGYLENKELSFVGEAAYRGTALAHRDGGVPNMAIQLSELSAYSLGALLYFFERACGISGYLLGVNPFDQPGVEAYKKNMFAFLGKPGSEAATKEVTGRLAAQSGDTTVKYG